MSHRWKWEQDDPSTSGAAGNFAKQFKNLQVKTPGIMAAEAPAPDAVLIAREVIQNSWDSAAELRMEEHEAGRDEPDFELEFVFEQLVGSRAAQVADAIGLHEHQARLDAVTAELNDRAAARKELGLGPNDCLEAPDTINALTIIERGTAGMYGPWTGRNSKMYLALLSVGFTKKHAGAGGSYGFGKAGLIRGSRVRTVVAYSCFREREDDPGVTRRLLGMTYWAGHELDGEPYTGFARLGQSTDNSAEPFENDAADELAERLGMTARDADDVDDLGTTFLLLDTGLQPHELCSAIERNWWPVLEDGSFHTVVVDHDGNRLIPRPRKRPDLLPFVRALEIATVKQDSKVDHEFVRPFNAHKAVDGVSRQPGTVGLVANIDAWSYPAAGGPDVDHRSLVALVRGPRMVVEYLDVGGNVPHVRGTFVAHDDVDDLLRQTEPPLHDAWDTHDAGDDIAPAATEVANVVHRRIRTAVRDFRNALKPPVPDKRDLQLEVLEDLMSAVFEGTGSKPQPPPPAPPREVSIRLDHQSLVTSDHDPLGVHFSGRATFALADGYPGISAEVAVLLRYKFVEDGAAGTDCPMNVNAPAGFTEDVDVRGRYVGQLTHDPVQFAFTTADYDADWSGQLSVEADVVEVAP